MRGERRKDRKAKLRGDEKRCQYWSWRIQVEKQKLNGVRYGGFQSWPLFVDKQPTVGAEVWVS